ncbi:MAG: thioredoxin family protein [Parachlamydiaceae bacterium]|nr:thioredoxin family protein [Parachlamydiaceae bacterium]
MKFLFCFIALLVGGMTAPLPAETALQHEGITWLTNYEEAVNKAKSSSKPIILFFTGSDWCSWCTKLDKEVFETQEFATLAGNQFIFLKLDFPLNHPLPPQQSTQNKQLQKKFDIRSFPTLVILDPSGQQKIGHTGYRTGGGRQYAEHLRKMVENHTNYKKNLQASQNGKLSGLELRKLYEKSKELDLPNDTSCLLKLGMQSELKSYFLTERYRFLAEEGLIHNKEAVAIKQQLFDLDPNNLEHAHYDIAVIEFEAFSEEKGRSKDAAIEPLLDYIDKFGSQDRSNLWRLEMIVSQVYLDKNHLTAALKHAQASYDSSPNSVHNEIASAIRNIQSQINATR